MSTPEETYKVLCEIRDLLASQHDRYEVYLDKTRESEERTNKRYDEYTARNDQTYKAYRNAAWRRLIAWMVWATVMIAVLSYWNR